MKYSPSPKKILHQKSTMLKLQKLVQFVFLLIWLGFGLSTRAQSSSDDPSPLVFPVPQGVEHQLFYVQRDPNINTLICQLNLDASGNLNAKIPVKVFWIRYGENGARKELSYIQRKFAYGVESKHLGNGRYELKFAAKKDIPMYLEKSAIDKQYHVYVTANQKKLKLDRIFLRIEGGTFWFPNVKYVEFKGSEANQPNKPAIERIKL